MLKSLHQDDGNGREQIISYLKLRFAIGVIGVSLPFLLIISNILYNGSIIPEDSISDYYDNGIAGDVFVGILFVLGFFLSSYRGESLQDSRVASIASIFAIGAALLPTTSHSLVVRNLHLLFAGSLFLVFAYFALVLFRRNKLDPRDIIYKTSGIIMIFCILIIIIGFRMGPELRNQYNLTFWAESIALISFGVSWIAKAEVSVGDFVISFAKGSRKVESI